VNADRPAPAGVEGVTERLAASRVDLEAAIAAVQLLGAKQVPGHPDQVMGECGHPMPGKEWIQGWRVCKTCPQQGLFDMPEPNLGTAP
jgi:hypothetical protein